MKKRGDITGKRFGRLVAIRMVERKPKSQIWLMKCTCGVEKKVRKGDLFAPNGTVSCGCWRRERPMKHGMRKTRIYAIWSGILTRVRNDRRKEYKRYGGKGIRIERRWNNFQEFYADMGVSYEKHVQNFSEKDTSLERKDNSKGYSKENCIWATVKVQSRNKSNNIKYNGEIAADASRRLSGNNWLVYSRVKSGWPLKEAFTLPVGSRLI